MSKLPIQLNVFLHKDLRDIDENLLYIQYFDWLTDTISRISDRVMDVHFIKPEDAPAICTYDYKTDDLQQLMDGAYETLLKYLNENFDDYGNDALHKYLLLTRDDINKKTLGVAHTPGLFGIASTTSRITASHEVGHLLNARHEDSAERNETYMGNGPFKSIMTAVSSKQAFVFSDKNEENIRNYLNQFD